MGRSLDEITKILEVVGLEKKRSQVYCLVYIIWAFCLCHKRLYHCHAANGATGYAVISSQKGDTEAQQRLMAIKASKLDAYRSLTEQVYGQWIDASDNMVDFALSEDQLKARVEGVIYGARLVSITPIGGETYETKLSLDQKTVNEIIENYLGGRKAKARTRDAEIRARRLITSNETR